MYPYTDLLKSINHKGYNQPADSLDGSDSLFPPEAQSQAP